jgi:hypothetical protein
MSNTETTTRARFLLTQRIITIALIGGLTTMTAIAVFMNLMSNPAPATPDPKVAVAQPGPPIVTYLAIGIFLSNAALAFVLPGIMAKQGVSRIAAGTWTPPDDAPAGAFDSMEARLLAVWQSSQILGHALIEGAGLLGAIAYLQEGQILALVVAVAALVALALRFPSDDRLARWLEIHRPLADGQPAV